MHLPNGEHTLRRGDVSELGIGEVKPGSQDSFATPSSGTSVSNRAGLQNEIRLQLSQDRNFEELLDIVLTSWTILIQRYQRDVFHQFTWGAKTNQDTDVQCIPTVELDLLKHRDTESLKARVGAVKSKAVPADFRTTLFLNDGTKAEVPSAEC